VNTRGEVFAASLPAESVSLPLFGGPEGSAPQMLAYYREFTGLLSPLGRTPRVLTLSPRQAWQLRLDDGLILELGRDQPKHPLQERLQRFAATYGEALSRAKTAIAAIDMRYPNGFALRPARGESAVKKSGGIAGNAGGNMQIDTGRVAHYATRNGKGNT
jgi:cell division protein FtsQ